MSSTTLDVQAGEPYAVSVTVTDGKDIWGTLGAFEVRCQVRRYASETSDLIADLGEHCTAAYAGNDIVITMALTGAATRALSRRSGHYDMFISDAGVTDARAYRVLWGTVSITPAVTTAS